DWNDTVRERGFSPPVYGLIRFAAVSTSLRMADNDVPAAGLEQHRCRNLSRKRARIGPMHGLCAERQLWIAAQLFGNGGERRERRRDYDVDVRMLPRLVDEQGTHELARLRDR